MYDPVLDDPVRFFWVIDHFTVSLHSPNGMQIDQSHKPHNASVPYPIMHHFVTEMCTCVHISVTKWCILGYLSDALWNLWDGSIVCRQGCATLGIIIGPWKERWKFPPVTSAHNPLRLRQPQPISKPTNYKNVMTAIFPGHIPKTRGHTDRATVTMLRPCSSLSGSPGDFNPCHQISWERCRKSLINFQHVFIWLSIDVTARIFSFLLKR